MTHRDARAGTTLLETLVALSVMAMVAAILSSGFGATIRNLDRSAELALEVDYAIARRDFRLWLENASLVAVPDDGHPLLQGTGTELQFLAQSHTPDFWPGSAVEVTLGTQTTVVQLRGFGADGKSLRDTSLTIADPDLRLSFQYWGRISPDATPVWQDDWPSALVLPDLVKITFIGSGRPPPALVIRPAKAHLQREMSLSSLLPPALPSRP
jgi:type II secretory pathway pseudopilin PulG